MCIVSIFHSLTHVHETRNQPRCIYEQCEDYVNDYHQIYFPDLSASAIKNTGGERGKSHRVWDINNKGVL